ncbi:hypothetical protein JCM14469_18730 [Desulfatiferula olefinivorans]
MSAIDFNGGDHIPQVVFAAIGLEGTRWYTAGKKGIAFQTIFSGFWVTPVKFGTDILPTDSDQNISGKIQHSAEYICKLVKFFQHRLDGLPVENVTETQLADISPGFENGLNFFACGFLAFFKGGLFLFKLPEKCCVRSGQRGMNQRHIDENKGDNLKKMSNNI